jgi:polyisoprenoid-binding protein YceI
MNKQSLIVVSALLWSANLQAQATPSVAKPAATGVTTSTAGTPQPAKATPTTAATAAANNDKSVEWTLDAAHSHIGFTTRHLVSKSSGQFKKYSAVVKADPKTGKLTNLEATIDAASVDTGIEKRDAHLRSEDFFAADKYPQLKLVTKSVKWSGNKFTATADLTIRDVTKTVPFKGELLGVHAANFGQGEHLRAGYEATATINRKDFGLKFSGVNEGIALVGDEVTIDLTAELMYTPAGASAAAPAAKPAAGAVASATKPEAATSAGTAKPAPAAAAKTAPASTPATPAHTH